MLQIQKKISSYNFNSSNIVKYIVIHDVGAYGTAKNNVDYFYGGNRGASAHYFVDDTSIWQSVEDFRGAWHVGDNNGYGKFAFGITNSNSIGIEMCLPSHDVTELTENNTIELVKYLMKKYNVPIERVVRHYDASRKNCPATFSANNWARWNRFKAKLNGQTSAQPNKPVEKPQSNNIPKIKTVEEGKKFVGNRCKELQQKLIKIGYDCGGFGADGIYGKETHEDLIAFQKKHGLVADGLAGNNTFKKLDEVIKNMSTSKPKPSSELYRVRKTWSDVSSQKGAYSDKNNAIAECKKHPGYKVFNSAGKEVYSNSASNPSTPPKKPNNVKQNTRSIQFLCNKVLGSKLALDGIWGKNTEAQVKKLKLCGYPYVNRDCTRYVQEVLGINEDGIFGRNTEKKVKEFQKKHGLSCDGIVGFNTYKALAIK